MSKTFQSTALLFFSRSLEEEMSRKTLLENSVNNSICISSLRSHSLSITKKSGLPVFNYSEHLQRGNSFGERISNAFQYLFDLGFTNVISVGNDCPDISVSDIKSAENRLAENSIVLGPDQHGGAFLIGLSLEAFKQSDFAKLDWQTDHLIASFQNYAENLSLDPSFIGQKIDLNTIEDVGVFATVSNNLSSILTLIYVLKSFVLLSIATYYTVANTDNHSRRGPPEIIESH